MTQPGTEVTRVVHVTEASGAGVETYLRHVAEHVAPQIHHRFILGHEDAFAAELRARGFDVDIVAMPRTRMRLGELRAAVRLRQHLLAVDADVIHLHSAQAGFVGRLALLRGSSRVRVVYTPHAYYHLGKAGLARFVFLQAERVLSRLVRTEVLATSLSEAERAVEDVRVPRRLVSTVMNGVETDEAGTGPRRAGRPFRVGFAGRITPQKNLPMFLAVVARLAARADHVRCEVIGVGHYADDRSELEEQLAVAGLTGADLDIVPWMERTVFLDWLSRCDVVVLTSVYESFGYSLAEASARGVPVVGTDVDGIRDVIVEGVNGHVVPLHDDLAMTQRILGLVSDPEHYQRLSAGALDLASSTLSVARFGASLTEFYEGGGQR